LGLHEKFGPENELRHVVCANKFGFHAAASVELLFAGSVEDATASESHGSSGVAFEVGMNCESCANKPVDNVEAVSGKDEFIVPGFGKENHEVFETCLDKSIGGVCCHHIAFLVGIDGRCDEDAFGRGSGAGGFLFGEVGSGLGTLADTTVFDSAIFLFTKEHHSGLRLLLLQGHKFGKVNGHKAVVMVELIELINGNLVAAHAECPWAFLENELLGKQSTVAANAAIDVEDQSCKDRGQFCQMVNGMVDREGHHVVREFNLG